MTLKESLVTVVLDLDQDLDSNEFMSSVLFISNHSITHTSSLIVPLI